MTDREAMQMALDALEGIHRVTEYPKLQPAITALRAQLEQPEQEPLTEEELEQAYRYIWSNIPENFDHTSMDWIEQGIRYAEQAHGIGEKP